MYSGHQPGLESKKESDCLEMQSDFKRFPASLMLYNWTRRFRPVSLSAILKWVNFIQDVQNKVKISKSTCRRIFDLMTTIFILSLPYCVCQYFK